MRKNSTPCEIAGVAMAEFAERVGRQSSNFGPALTTWTCPSSLVKYSFPSAATGEAVNPTPPSRRWL